MRPIFTAMLTMFLVTPTLGSGQAPVSGEMHESAFETLREPGGRLLQRSPTELILSSEPQALRIPATTIDTLWTRGYSTKAGGIVGAMLGAGLGAVVAASLGETDTDRAALWAGSIGGGTVAGGLVGMLLGTALPVWKRRIP